MLSIEEFKKYLPSDLNLTEEQILKLRDDMDTMAGILFEMWLKERKKKANNGTIDTKA